jgi:hypothetical protein
VGGKNVALSVIMSWSLAPTIIAISLLTFVFCFYNSVSLYSNRWRPRWFVLHQDQHILTYYLLANQDGGGPQQVSSSIAASIPSSLSSASPANRRRTFSESSNVSENTVDYDVVPRGTIFLLGSTVEVNESLTRPEEQLYALTITDHENSVHCHLAARTLESQEQWVTQIAYACQGYHDEQSQRQHGGRPPIARLMTPTTASRTRSIETPTPSRGNLRRTEPSTPTANQNGTTATTIRQPFLRQQSVPGDEPSIQEDLPSESYTHIQEQQSRRSTKGGWTVVKTEKLTKNVPIDLANQIDDVLAKYLPYVDDKDHPEWKLRSDSNDVHFSVHVEKPMIRSIRTVSKHHPMEYLRILLNFSQSMEYETNVRTVSVLKQFNANTSFVYKAYHPVWPTSARDFAAVTFWCLLDRVGVPSMADKQALCLVSFSCDEADEMKPPEPNHVRGTLDVSLNFFRLTENGTCYHSRIMSYSLNGTIPIKMMRSILEQQATMPRVMDVYLSNRKKRSEESLPTFGNYMDYNTVYKFLEDIDDANGQTITHHQDLDRSLSIVTSKKKRVGTKRTTQGPPLWKHEAVVLLTPIVVYNLVSILTPGFGALSFAIMSMYAIRWVILQHLLAFFSLSPINADSTRCSVIVGAGTTSCRFNVDLKGVLRFLANEKESKAHLEEAGTEILVSHIVVRSLAKAMVESPGLISRNYPFLPSLSSVDVMVHDQKSSSAIWVLNPDDMSIQDVADFLALQSTTSATSLCTYVRGVFGPTCRLWTSPDSIHSQVDVDVNTIDCPVVVCISGIRLEKESKTPTLSVSVNLKSANVDSCRSFSERVQRLIQFPEMCDDE